MASATGLGAYQWEPQPAAEEVVRGLVEKCLQRSEAAAKLAERMRVETGTRFGDWIDFIVTPEEEVEKRLKVAGFVMQGVEEGLRVYRHEEGMFPRVAVGGPPPPGDTRGVEGGFGGGVSAGQ